MKTNNFLIILIALFALLSVSTYAQDITFDGENEGVVMLSVYEIKTSKKSAIEKAVKDSFFQVMYRGIPGSKLCSKPFLGTKDNVPDAQRRYYDNMISSGRVYSFVTFMNLRSYKRRDAVVQVSFNVNALVDDLERNNLYRRFGLY